MLATFGAMLGGSLRAAQVARRRLAAELDVEREAKARLEGEFAAARAVQMSLLPHRFPAFPERRDFEVYARIEPARMVGGDLFDFLLIDDSRLFFIIADVSGKGMPAALLMAMTKQIVRDAVQRHGTALDRLMTEANIKTAAASAEMGQSGDMMFVTAFAGILDLASGELVYASAGHDAPFLLQAGGRLRQLETRGGPPLGAVEHFRFPVDRDRCERGAVLLLYTDGVTEAQNPGGSLFSVERLTALLGALPATGDAYDRRRRLRRRAPFRRRGRAGRRHHPAGDPPLPGLSGATWDRRHPAGTPAGGRQSSAACRRRKSISSGSTASGCSCCTQWPAPSSRWQPTMRVQAALLHALEARPAADRRPSRSCPR